jgi:outer membrane protein OmpA-like peptidoglycan-associated protein
MNQGRRSIILEDDMSLSCNRRIGRTIVAGLSLLCVVLFCIAFISSPALAQTDATPKWDVFVGYQWLHPGGNVPDPTSDPNNPTPLKLQDGSGGGGALTYNFDPHWGGEIDFGSNWLDHASETTASIGPRYMVRTDSANFFIHGLLSYNRLAVDGLNGSNGIGAILGGGIDLPIRKWLAFRLFEADYVWARHNYASFAPAEFPDLRRPSLEGARLRTGLVFSWGGAPPVAPAASCSVQPAEVMVGEPITATVTSSNFNPKHTVTYSWSANGGVVTGKDTTAAIDTTNAAPGSYAITAHVTDPKSTKNNTASCSANFTVKPLPPKNPPTMSCSVSPSSVQIPGSATITCSCTSPDGVSVSVSNWNASSGTLSGAGSTATLSTAGTSPGTVTIGATCSDTRGLTGQASTQLTVENPPPPPVNPEIVRLEARLSLHSIYFVTNFPTAANPKGGLLASQQKTLVELASDFKKYLESKPDAHLILGGHADHRGSAEFNQALSERRVARTKSFLIEQGIPEASIETKAFGKEHNLTTEEVQGEVQSNTELTTEERARVLKNIDTIRMASNRRVDVTLSTTGQTSVRQFPFNATDALTLIGGREAAKKPVAKKPVAKKPVAKKPAPKK